MRVPSRLRNAYAGSLETRPRKTAARADFSATERCALRHRLRLRFCWGDRL